MTNRIHAPRRASSIRAVIVQSLEQRRLFAAPPVTPGPNFAAADDTYNITVTPASGATITAATPVTSVAWGATTPVSFSGGGSGAVTLDAFTVTLHSGPASPTFLRWVTNGSALTQVKIESKRADGLVRGSWLLETAFVKSFGQDTGPDGVREDVVSFGLSKITDTFRRYYADGSLLDETVVGFNRATNTGTNTGTASQTFNSDYLATTPDIAETLELGAGQLPIANTAFSFVNSGTITTGVTTASALNYSFVDGRESLAIFSRVVTGAHTSGAVYESRDPASGAALQRYRFGNVAMSHYGFYDSVFDNLPRVSTSSIAAARYELLDYSYSGTNNELQAVTSYGWDFSAIAQWSPGGNAAHVAGPTSGAVASAINAVTFRFNTAVTLTLANFSFDGFATAGLTLTAADANQTWTVGNLAPQQAADGHYAVKLLAYKFNPNTSGDTNILIGSAGKSWDLDRSSPVLVGSSFDFDAAPPTPYAFDFTLSEPVTATAVDGTAPILIRRMDTGALVTTATARVAADGVTLTANLGATLADARYRATLPAGSVRDAAGNLLASDLDLPFFVLAGDANHDAKVDFNDLVALAQNYNQAGRSFAQGNFNYDTAGDVDFADLVILAQQYNKSLPPLPLASVAPGLNRDGDHRDIAGDVLA